MSTGNEYLILPVLNVTLGTEPTWVSWKLPGVAALQRLIVLVTYPRQAMAIAGLSCSLRLGHYTMQDVELRHLEDAVWLQRNANHHLVMKTGDEITIGLGPMLRETWRVGEVSMTAILRLPPPCFTPRDAA